MVPANQFDLCPWGSLIAMPHMGWQHAGWFASYVVRATNILEWGSGGSTLWMAMMAPNARMHIIEHDGVWLDRVGEVLLALRATTVAISMNVLLSECQDTVSYVVDVGTNVPYDLVFIDGQERPACLAASYDLLAPGGVVFLHDSERVAYTDAKWQLLERPGMALIDERTDESWVNQRAGMWAAQMTDAPVGV